MSFLPFGQNTFVLREQPYLSRIDQHENNVTANNYVMIAYKPGQPLQAAELNEIQENFYRMNSLTQTMNYNWLGGPGVVWDKDYGTGSTIIPDNTVGVGEDDGSTLTVHGPGWAGATPLYPFRDPHASDPSSAGTEMVEAIVSDTGINFTFKSGWYLVESADEQNLQGLKIWVHLNENVTLDNQPTSGNEYNVGIITTKKTVTSSDDPSLSDQSGSEDPITSATADRIQIADITANSSVVSSLLSPIFKIIPARREIRYMNNLLFKTWS